MTTTEQKTLEQVAAMVAETLMPDAPDLVRGTAESVARALLKDHAVVELPAPSRKDSSGVTWFAWDGFELAKVTHGLLWIGDDILTPDQADETAGALLAASRLATANADQSVTK